METPSALLVLLDAAKAATGPTHRAMLWGRRSAGLDEGVMTYLESPEVIAERIVNDHDLACVGVFDADAPYCACAPAGTPLCKGCSALAAAIAAAITAERVDIEDRLSEAFHEGLAAAESEHN